MSKHQAKFTWGAGPNKVTIAGGFNEWSDSATPLQKQADGSFAADVPLPWGEKQAFKYVVDGEWKVREDEAKEWDAAGNMNNVYTAPHPPAADAPKETASTKENETSAAAPAAAPAAAAVAATSAPVAAEHTKSAPSPTEATKSEPAVSEASAPAPSTPATKETEPSSLLASSAPSAASKGPSGIPTLGAVTLPTSHANPPKTVETHATAAPVPSIPVAPVPAPAVATAAVPIEAAPKVTDSTPVKIEKTAANANIGQAPNGTEAHTIQETAQEYAHQVAEVGAGALASIGAAVGSAVLAVENATGVHILGGQPLTVEEARAQGIDISTLEKKDAPTDALSPVGTKPPADAVKDLEEKTKELKLNAGKGEFANTPEPLESVNHRKNDLPAQNEVDNHKTIPAPQITPVAPKDPKKERSLDAATSPTTSSTKPVSTDPAVDAKQAKKEAENSSSQTGSTHAVAQGKHVDSTPPNPVTSQPGKAAVRPDAPSNNINTDAPPTPPKDKAPLPAAAAPATPAKVNGTPAAATVTPGSIASTPASTPAKAAHTREETNGSDVRKRKSSFFTKIKHAFSPKDKEKK